MRVTIASTFLALAVCVAGCGTAKRSSADGSQTAPADSDYGPVRQVTSRDGSFDGQVIGNMVPDGKFSKLQIGMLMPEVLGLIGGPDGMTTHETGKRWIPLYFGPDARRVEVLYKGEGCLTYTGGNAWGGGDNRLIRITATDRTDCTE